MQRASYCLTVSVSLSCQPSTRKRNTITTVVTPLSASPVLLKCQERLSGSGRRRRFARTLLGISVLLGLLAAGECARCPNLSAFQVSSFRPSCLASAPAPFCHQITDLTLYSVSNNTAPTTFFIFSCQWRCI